MTDNVVEFDGDTVLDIPPERILDAAKGTVAKSCVVLGWTEDGKMYLASSTADASSVLWLLEAAKLEIMEAAR